MGRKKPSKKKKLDHLKKTQREIKNALKASDEPLSIRQLKRRIHAKTAPHIFNDALDFLRAKGVVTETRDGKYSYNKDKQTGKQQKVTGTVDMTSAGNAYIISPDWETDIFVSRGNMNKAFDGDRVKVEITKVRGKKPEGKVLEIVNRAQREIVGTLELTDSYGFVVPDHRKIPIDLFIPPENIKDVRNGDRVIARIVSWEDNKKNPIGEIVESLGHLGANDAEMKSILVQAGFPLKFPQAVMKEVDEIPTAITEEEVSRRRDFRNVTTMTIDPVDAKDFDDALSFEELDNGHYRMGIHIADVTYYLKPGTQLEKEAYKRSTSVYLVDRVLPMLPEKLSNIVCSLRPNEDKLCYAAVFELNQEAEIVERWFGRTVINSDRRFAYEEVQEVIEGSGQDYNKEIKILNDLATKLRERKFQQGAIAFETVEFKFQLDMDGVPVDVLPRERKEAHMLIEDFMLLANREVAEFVGKPRKGEKVPPFVYRIHDTPDPEKLASFAKMAQTFGYKFQYDTPRQVANSLNKLMKQIKGRPEQDILENLAIRSMAKAVYSPDNIGHYGLGFEYYTHFTSPIRRYPDVLVHRLLDDVLNKRTTKPAVKLEDSCRHSSWMEQKAVEAERESVKYKQVEYMQDKVGQEFEGIISGVVSFGLFVELIETRCEGLVDIDSLSHDFFIYNETNHALIGSDTGLVYRLGDKVNVKVIKADLERRRLDYELTGPV